MRASCLLLFLATLSGCTTALDRESRCLTSLTPDYLTAKEELLKLDAAWRAAGRRASAFINEAAQVEVRQAYRRLQDARMRLRPTLEWYERVYDRLLLRSEEEDMLADARMMLFTGPAALFYPIVRWNLREVMWDGADPDADTDPVTNYCSGRLAAASEQVEVEAKVEPASARFP